MSKNGVRGLKIALLGIALFGAETHAATQSASCVQIEGSAIPRPYTEAELGASRNYVPWVAKNKKNPASLGTCTIRSKCELQTQFQVTSPCPMFSSPIGEAPACPRKTLDGKNNVVKDVSQEACNLLRRSATGGVAPDACGTSTIKPFNAKPYLQCSKPVAATVGTRYQPPKPPKPSPPIPPDCNCLMKGQTSEELILSKNSQASTSCPRTEEWCIRSHKLPRPNEKKDSCFVLQDAFGGGPFSLEPIEANGLIEKRDPCQGPTVTPPVVPPTGGSVPDVTPGGSASSTSNPIIPTTPKPTPNVTPVIPPPIPSIPTPVAPTPPVIPPATATNTETATGTYSGGATGTNTGGPSTDTSTGTETGGSSSSSGPLCNCDRNSFGSPAPTVTTAGCEVRSCEDPTSFAPVVYPAFKTPDTSSCTAVFSDYPNQYDKLIYTTKYPLGDRACGSVANTNTVTGTGTDSTTNTATGTGTTTIEDCNCSSSNMDDTAYAYQDGQCKKTVCRLGTIPVTPLEADIIRNDGSIAHNSGECPFNEDRDQKYHVGKLSTLSIPRSPSPDFGNMRPDEPTSCKYNMPQDKNLNGSLKAGSTCPYRVTPLTCRGWTKPSTTGVLDNWVYDCDQYNYGLKTTYIDTTGNACSATPTNTSTATNTSTSSCTDPNAVINGTECVCKDGYHQTNGGLLGALDLTCTLNSTPTPTRTFTNNDSSAGSNNSGSSVNSSESGSSESYTSSGGGGAILVL